MQEEYKSEQKELLASGSGECRVVTPSKTFNRKQVRRVQRRNRDEPAKTKGDAVNTPSSTYQTTTQAGSEESETTGEERNFIPCRRFF